MISSVSSQSSLQPTHSSHLTHEQQAPQGKPNKQCHLSFAACFVSLHPGSQGTTAAMAQVVMIRGRYVSTNRVIGLFVSAIIMATASAVNLGLGINYDCWGYNDYWCEYQRRTYIIVGSCFAASAFLFLVAALSLNYKIRKILRNNTEVVVQQPVCQVTETYPTSVVVTGQPYNPAPVGFVVDQQQPPMDPFPGDYAKQQPPPPPYSPQ